ncbi:MAG: TPR end-of-group domain-containing protein [Albidovulum sp.]
MFAKAIELDPLYARAYAGAADCDSFLYLDYSEGASLSGILASCAKALDLESNLAEARASRGLALSAGQRYDEAEAEFELAVASNPNLFEAHYFWGRSCFVQGKFEQAAVHWERAAEIKPDDFQSSILSIQIYRALGRMKDMERAVRRGTERAERAVAKNPENNRAAYLLASAFADIGEIEKAKVWAARALAIDPEDSMARYNIACFYSLCGEFDCAFDLLLGLLPQSNTDTKAWTLIDFDLEPLHSDPRWQTVLDMAR